MPSSSYVRGERMEHDPTVWDPELLRRLEAGSPGVTRAILEVYRRDLAGTIEQLPVLQKAGDAEVVRRAVHKLKGSSGSIGARAVQACAQRLEASCRETGVASDHEVEALIQAGRCFLAHTSDLHPP
jgi:HPt (histidine-containing phosphotransfer) domain-containing protein